MSLSPENLKQLFVAQVLAWKAFARTKGQEYSKMKVVFEDVMFYRITILPRTGEIITSTTGI